MFTMKHATALEARYMLDQAVDGDLGKSIAQ